MNTTQIGENMSAELDGFLGIINKLLAFLGSSGEGQTPPTDPQA
ncbi:hypothetical protein REQ_39520 [Prescottella equi 103S]|uniref:Uncharacterized protein n=1 Tax=Rhodococcus hoagii (strain 103S) TaxID=685727 RepID=A0A3S5YBK0_RHOH1|nr:hypothetical protein REQ_39520 [Prescottella equi 103S]